MVTWIVQNTRVILPHDIEILCECVVFPQKGYIFIHDIQPCYNSKSIKIFQECKEILVLELLGNRRHINTIENVWNIMKRLVTKCHVKRKRCGSQYVKRGIV